MSDEYSYMQFRFLCTMLLFLLALLRANTVSINSLNIAEAYSLLRSSSIHGRNKFGYFYEIPEILKLVLLLILLSGDIERISGPVMTCTQTLRIIQNKENYLKYAHLNFKDIRKEQNGLKDLSNDLGLNTILDITETWLTKKDEFKTWDISSKTHKCFRYERKCVDKTKGGGILLYILYKLEPKEIPDQNLCDTELFESLWVELKGPQVASHVNKVLLNVLYNPQKSFSGLFLDNLSESIDVAMLKTTNIVLMGDYNLDYLNHPEQNHLDLVLNHFN